MTPPPAASLLIRGLAAGEPQAFAALYDRLAGPLLRVGTAMLNSRHEAEDALHDLFVNLARGRSRLAAVEDLDAYVFASLRHFLRAQLARRATERKHLLRIAQSRADAIQAAPDPQDDVTAALGALPEEQRDVVVLKIDGGLTFAQIAQVLNVSPNTAASRYRYALEKLRCQLKEPG